MDQRIATRLLSLNEDLSPDLRTEQAECITIRHLPVKQEAPRPLVLPISGSTQSNETMGLIKKWLEIHRACGQVKSVSEPWNLSISDPLLTGHSAPTGIRYQSHHRLAEMDNYYDYRHHNLPSRLIDVSGNDLNTVRIVETRDFDENLEKLPFLALSHCWGRLNPAPKTLVKENLSAFYQAVPISALSQTSQDAIHITRCLGFAYIWIDSLCIVQDDAADWAQQALLMKEVYEFAACVLSAAAAWDGSETMFAQQDPLAIQPCLVGVRKDSRHKGGDYGIYALPSSRFTEPSEQDIKHARIRSRGWCFQEERLAKKIVWFGANQVSFTCQVSEDPNDHHTSCQAGRFPWAPDTELEHHPVYDMVSGRKKLPMNPMHNDSSLHVRLRWWQLVHDYSLRMFTKSSDKLIALEGLTDVFQLEMMRLMDFTGPVYLSGLWGGVHLPSSLLWYAHERHPRPFEISDVLRRGPSFTWASIDGVIKNNSTIASHLNCGLEIRGHTAVSTSDLLSRPLDFPITPFHAGSIYLGGKITRVEWRYSAPSEKRYYIGHRDQISNIREESDLAYFVPWHTDSTLGPEILDLYNLAGSMIGIFLPDTTDPPPAEIFCLRIAVVPEDPKLKRDFGVPFVMRGIALTPVEGVKKTYKRVGYIELEKGQQDVGGILYPHAGTGELDQSLRQRAWTVRYPFPNPDPSGFFGHPKDIAREDFWII